MAGRRQQVRSHSTNYFAALAEDASESESESGAQEHQTANTASPPSTQDSAQPANSAPLASPTSTTGRPPPPPYHTSQDYDVPGPQNTSHTGSTLANSPHPDSRPADSQSTGAHTRPATDSSTAEAAAIRPMPDANEGDQKPERENFPMQCAALVAILGYRNPRTRTYLRDLRVHDLRSENERTQAAAAGLDRADARGSVPVSRQTQRVGQRGTRTRVTEETVNTSTNVQTTTGTPPDTQQLEVVDERAPPQEGWLSIRNVIVGVAVALFIVMI